MDDSRPVPGQIHTRAEFKAACERLRTGLSYKALNAAVGGGLPQATASNLLNPEMGLPGEATLEVFLRACGVPREQEPAWLAARKRVLSGDPRAAGLIRVSQAEPRRLGVHAAIDVPGASGELPAYVERDTDTAARGVRALIGKAAEDGLGGLVVLVGSSSVGKTRCGFEAIRALLPDWWLLHPSDADQVRAIAADPPARLVVWLDELQRYFDAAEGLHAGPVRDLLGRGAVLVATLWPDRYATYTAVPQKDAPDPHARARELLGLAEVADIAECFTPAERSRAEQVAEDGDARLAVALRADDYGLTQTIAAAPQLMRRWRQADAYAAAVLNAAVDATRLGATTPLSAVLLREAAPGYCDARQRAKAPAKWFESAMAYLTEELHGAASVLAPVAAPHGGMGQVIGYQVADYLQQHAAAERRRRDKIPAACWQALADHLTDPGEQIRVGHAADRRMLYRYADSLYRKAAQAGDTSAIRWLAELLAERGQVEELRELADAGNEHAAKLSAKLLAEWEHLEYLRARAAAGDDEYYAKRLAGLLTQLIQVEELQARANAGDEHAAHWLAELLAGRRRVEELRELADAGFEHAARLLAKLLARLEWVEELRELADAGDEHAAHWLAELLAGRGQVEELRELADAGFEHAARLLTERWWVEETERLWRDGLQAE